MSANTYSFTVIDPVAGGTVTSAAINDSGEVAGTYIDPNLATHGFVDAGSAVSMVEIGGATTTVVTGVNDSGQITGYSFTAGANGNSNVVGFVGQPGSLGPIAVPGTDVEPLGITAAGSVVGNAGQAGFTDSGGLYSALAVPGATLTRPTAANAAGEVVGDDTDANNVVHGFTDVGGVVAAIDPPQSAYTTVVGVTSSGEVAGSYNNGHNDYGFTDVNGDFTLLLPSTVTVVTGVNDAGTTVGYELGADSQLHGFIDLNGAIDTFDPPGSVNTQPTGINGSGEIVGVYDDASGFEHAFTATVMPACYCPGTLIRTDHGEVAVEKLAIGDRVITAGGAAEPVCWIGRRSYAGRFLRSRPELLPVRVRAGALGAGVPSRDLLVSPAHALLLDGVLVPAGELVNGRTVVREPAGDRVDYLHVELARHDVIWANGAGAETFVDDNSRAMFGNAAEYAALYPGARPVAAAYCAPRVVDGYALAAIRARLAGFAAARAA